MKSEELKDMTIEEVQLKLSDLDEELFNLRFQHSMHQLENQMKLKSVRREIAQMKTILRENVLGIRTLRGSDLVEKTEEIEK